MSDTTDSPKEQIDALRDMVESKGWAIYRLLVMSEIAGDFEEHITKALDSPDSTLALDRMRQVAAVRRAGLRWLKLPSERLKALTAEAERKDEVAHNVGRRPVGL